MKTKNLFAMLLMTFLTVSGLAACSDNDEEGKKVTDYKEYTLTVASTKLPGVIISCGNNVYGNVYAVKKEQSATWEALGGIGKFEYEPGYEYQIRISETSYLDYRMGDPAWTEYELLEITSKTHKDSENLPPHFIPDWYFEQYLPYIDPEFAYAIDADKKEEIENDLKTDAAYTFGGMRYYIAPGNWFLLDSEMKTVEQGTVMRRSKEATEFPESYKLLPPEYPVVGHGQLDFVKGADPEKIMMQYDVFLGHQPQSKSVDPQTINIIWLYKDLTAYYQSKFPEASVNAVAIRYTIKL